MSPFGLRTYRWSVGFVLLAGLTADKADAGEIVIGMSAVFSGPARGVGIEIYRGSMAYFEEINRAGGINGRPIRLLARDDGYDPARAIRNTIQFVENDNVQLLYGYTGTPTVTRVLPLLKQYEDRDINLFFPCSGAQPLRRPPYNKYVFSLPASYAAETAGLVENFLRTGRRRIAVYYQIDAFGRSGWAGVRDALARHKLRIAGEATYRSSMQFSESVRKQVEILRSRESDAVICIATHTGAAAFIRDARDADWDVPIAAVSLAGDGLIQLLLERASTQSGKDYTANLFHSQVVPSIDDTDLPAVREYRSIMRDRPAALPEGVATGDYEAPPLSFFSFEGFLEAKLLVELLRRAGPTADRAALRRTAEALKDFDLGIGETISFGPDDHQGMERIFYSTVAQGRFVTVPDWR